MVFVKKRPYFEKIKDILLKMDIIVILGERKPLETSGWIFLNTNLKFQFFFPEYQIKNITEDLRNQKMKKLLALKSLYALKRGYLKYEKPTMFQELDERIQAKHYLATSLEKKGEKPIDLAKELKTLYKDIGDYDNRVLWQKKLKEWEK